MEKPKLTINREFNSLDKVLTYLKEVSDLECTQVYDSWDVRTDANGQMEKCVLIKKSNMHGMKVYFTKENVLNTTYVIPNKMMNAYFGESKKARQGILEIITGLVKKALLSGSQKKAFNEMTQVLNKISA